ncbi:hypothetical protein E3N88_41964 [Mikania micrantha]|uniref:Uncharacterized protein n=1 Tax=Mikania micrantha TaxID=192012 RepID=A0A5N6LLE4_9ASTR|nr:hypothetical protein E3N88_41964 [Mikania micrantha]
MVASRFRRCSPLVSSGQSSPPPLAGLQPFADGSREQNAPDKGIRPIAVGGIWQRLVSKVAMKKVGKEMTQYLGDYQFGVGVPNGAEAVLHSANRFLNSFHVDGSLAS